MQVKPSSPASSADPISTAAAPRSAAIDHLRILLTALVIFHHVAIAYGGSGGWYWREQPNASNVYLLMFNAINQAYFMGFFFLLAGYYTPRSYERKGARRFLADRLVRLGVPLLIYFFVLAPLTVALARTSRGFPFWRGWWEMSRFGVFGPGPLWFAEALLFFAAGYVAWRRLRPAPSRVNALPGVRTLVLTAFGLGGISFLVRLVIPVGREFAWMQLGYFPCYLYLFAAGCAAGWTGLLEKIDFPTVRPWMAISLVTIATLPFAVFFRMGKGAFEGGWNANALYYALWDPFVAWGVILGLLWAAQTYWARPNGFTAWLARNAYGAYIVHPPVVVGLSVGAAAWKLSPSGKFVLVGAAACVGSFLIAGVLGAAPGARKIL